MAKLLIIEDEPELRDIYVHFLREFEIIFALEKDEIEAVIEQVDLVVSDYSFNPRLSFEQVREIVGDRKPLILCSGQFDKVDQYGGVHKIEASKQLKPRILALLGGVA